MQLKRAHGRLNGRKKHTLHTLFIPFRRVAAATASIVVVVFFFLVLSFVSKIYYQNYVQHGTCAL